MGCTGEGAHYLPPGGLACASQCPAGQSDQPTRDSFRKPFSLSLLRHRDVKTTTGTYGHLVVEDLREAINLLPPAPFAASLLQAPGSAPQGVHNSTISTEENQAFGLERETGIEPATLSLGS